MLLFSGFVEAIATQTGTFLCLQKAPSGVK